MLQKSFEVIGGSFRRAIIPERTLFVTRGLWRRVLFVEAFLESRLQDREELLVVPRCGKHRRVDLRQPCSHTQDSG